MSGLRDRMNRLRGSATDAESMDTVSRKEAGAEREELADEQCVHPAWSEFGVRLRTTAMGSYLLRVTHYPLHYRHGIHRLQQLAQAATGLQAFHPSEAAIRADQVLYLDLETTGLGVGAGNVPFMIGVAYMTHHAFVVEQTLIRHPAEERAMLYDWMDRFRNYNYLATYNGKTFDWPLMLNRMIMNGIDRHVWKPLHLDFLHPSRSVWRNTLSSLKLSHVEEERLGIGRSEDVPGSLAPQLYFQYLADGNPAPLAGVFTHNESDLLSLACLSIRFGLLLSGDIFKQIPYPEEAEELVRTGLWLEKMGDDVIAEKLFGLALHSTKSGARAFNMLAARDKKAGNWERAVLLWQKALMLSGDCASSEAHDAAVELAIYNEHKLKNIKEALMYAVEAQKHAMYSPPSKRRGAARPELEGVRKRIDRLERKLAKLR